MSAVKKLWCVRVTFLFWTIIGVCEVMFGPVGRIAGIIAGAVVGRMIQKGYADKCLQYNCYAIAVVSALIAFSFLKSGPGEVVGVHLMAPVTAVLSALIAQPREGYEPEEPEEETEEEEPEENEEDEYVLLSEEDAEIARELLEEMVRGE